MIVIFSSCKREQRDPTIFYYPAEWEPQEAMLMGWTERQQEFFPLVEDGYPTELVVPGFVAIGTDGHTDEYIRFANANTILLAWVDEEEKDVHPVHAENYRRLKETYDILVKAKDQDGRPFKIIKVPLPDLRYRPNIVVEGWASNDSTIGHKYFLPDDLKFTGRQAIEGELADTWKGKMKTFGTILSENGDLSPIAERVYADILADDAPEINIKWGENIVAAESHFLGEWDVSQKNVIKHGQKVQKIGLIRGVLPEEDYEIYMSVYLSEAGNILGVSDKVLNKE